MNTKLYYTTPEVKRYELKFESNILTFSQGNGTGNGQGMHRDEEENF